MNNRSIKKEAGEVSDLLCMQIIDAIGAGVLVSRQGRLLFANRAARELSGFDERELMARSVADLFHPDDRSRVEALTLDPKEGQSISQGHRMRIVTKSGTVRWVWSQSGQCLVDGKPTLMTSLVDCDAIVQDAQEEASERFFAVLNSIDALVSVIDMDTYEVLFMNQHGIDSFGEDFAGRFCYDVFQGGTEPCGHCTRIGLRSEVGEPAGVCKWEGTNPVTGRRYMRYDRAVKWVDGRYARLQVATDITQQKKLEKEQADIKSQLNRSQRMEAIGILAGGIAHEFNNILSIIRGYNEIALMEAEPASKQRDHLVEALKAGNRAAGLVQQILTFSRQAEQPQQPLHLAGLVKEAVKFLRASLPASIAIEHRVPADLLPVRGDPTRILQVLMNLCVNAAQAMGNAGGVLSVGLENVASGDETPAPGECILPGPHVRLTVTDTGPGIPSEVIDRIFDPDFTTKEPSDGSGLGLAIVKGIVRDHGGDVAVQSAPGRGATFSVLLPSDHPAVREGKSPSMALSKGSGRILFVDDEPAIERLGRQMLQRLGYEVESRTDSIQALELFSQAPRAFDLVITDLTMPGMRGDQLAKRIKRLRPDVPVILCTGYNDLVAPGEDGRRPFDRCLIKPVGMSNLADAVKQLLGNRGRSAPDPR